MPCCPVASHCCMPVWSLEPVVRPYWLIDDIERAVTNMEAVGAEIVVPPMDIPGKGKFAICVLAADDHGLWQL